MPVHRMIPALWVRLIVIIGFGIFVATQHLIWIAAVAVLLALLTAGQLASAYKEKRRQSEL
ncbi:hypothetical protein [Corynebacterium vitaeruminis]|uniref:hypothetical protein n=1 Tax=Corynebacterium vitaeruminis TaxID=38305 RepID=UPI0023F0AA9E|nr:hypothetical protein [Corynebacterium vitaeruminis]